jgi:transcription elongation factor Elf1
MNDVNKLVNEIKKNSNVQDILTLGKVKEMFLDCMQSIEPMDMVDQLQNVSAMVTLYQLNDKLSGDIESNGTIDFHCAIFDTTKICFDGLEVDKQSDAIVTEMRFGLGGIINHIGKLESHNSTLPRNFACPVCQGTLLAQVGKLYDINQETGKLEDPFDTDYYIYCNSCNHVEDGEVEKRVRQINQ